MPNIPWTRVSNYNNFTPAVFIGCTLWLDAMDSSSISTSSGNVTQWRDKSGNANHTTAGTGQPTYTAPYVVFGGAAQLILPLVFSTDWSIFVVAKTTQTTGASGNNWWAGAGLFDAEISGTANDYGMNVVGGYLATGAGNTDTTIQSVNQVNNGNLFIGEYLRTSSTGLMSNIVTGGTAVTTTGPTGIRNSVSRISLGALQTNINYFIGSIAEVVAFNVVISVPQRQSIEGYLAQKWGFVASLPAGHPGTKTNGPITINLPYSATFNPLSIAGCALWLDAADSSTVTGTNPITAWTDKAAGRSVTITSGPVYGTTTQNGLKTMYFNNNVISSSIASAVGLSDFTLIAVWYQYTGGTNTVLSLGTVASSSQSLGYSGNKYNFYQYGSLESAYTTGSAWVVQVGTRISSVKRVYITGTVGSVPASDSFNVTSTTITIGKGDNFQIVGEIAEIMVYTGTMSDTNRQLLESYLSQKWGLQQQLPVGHTYFTAPAGLPTSVLVQRATNQQVIAYVTTGLVYHLDAGNAASYPGSGSTWNDLASSGISMTLYGSPTYSSANGGYLSFVPSSSQYGSTSTSLPAASTWTVEAFIYYNGTNTGGLPCIFTDTYPGNTNSIQWTLGSLSGGSSTTLQAGYYSGGWFTTPVQSPLTSGNWYHVIGTYDGTNIKLYINGSLNQTTASATAPVQNTGGHRIMRRWDNADYWGGNLAVLRLYSRALSSTEVSQNYNGQKARFGLS